MRKLWKLAVAVTAWFLALGLRLLRIFPNNDPILPVAMPLARSGPVFGAAWAVASVLAFDLVTGTLGPWTAVVAPTFALVALWAGWFLRRYEARYGRPGPAVYLACGLVGVLVFDFITGPVVGTLVWRMPFVVALTGQVPFTLMHLASVAAYSLVVSPVLSWILDWSWNRCFAIRPASR